MNGYYAFPATKMEMRPCSEQLLIVTWAFVRARPKVDGQHGRTCSTVPDLAVYIRGCLGFAVAPELHLGSFHYMVTTGSCASWSLDVRWENVLMPYHHHSRRTSSVHHDHRDAFQSLAQN